MKIARILIGSVVVCCLLYCTFTADGQSPNDALIGTLATIILLALFAFTSK